MKRRKRYQSPDGLDWRDPDMPVYARAIDPRTNKVTITLFHADTIRDYYQHKINDPFYTAPTWREDETYDLASRHNRKGRDK